MSRTYDFVVVGGGMAGVAAAYELSAQIAVAECLFSILLRN
jgi:glycine/D-amino acid oxidase-like deaminating enzyme